MASTHSGHSRIDGSMEIRCSSSSRCTGAAAAPLIFLLRSTVARLLLGVLLVAGAVASIATGLVPWIMCPVIDHFHRMPARGRMAGPGNASPPLRARPPSWR